MNRNIKCFSYAAAALIAVSCGNSGKDRQTAATENAGQENVLTMEQQQPNEYPKVKVAKVEREDVPQTAVYTSTVQAYAKNNIAPQTSLRITAINVEVGDFVHAGQVLAQMDKLQLQQAELQMKNNELEYNRLKELFNAGGLSQSDLDAIELSYKVSKTTYQNLLTNTVLRSPLSGVVTARNYDKGDMFTMGQPIFTVEQITPVKLLVGISETDYSKVSKGDLVEVVADAFPNKTFEGKISRVYPTIDAATHTFNVEIQVPNKDKVLRPGMFARVTVQFGINRSIVVPDSAIVKQTGSGERFVYVLNDDGTVTYQNVKLGRRIGAKYEVLSGLNDDAFVVSEGQARLKDGVAVDVVVD